MSKNYDYNDHLRQENELTRLKIKAEFGVDLNENGNLNPAIENMWLNQILEFERAAIKNEKTTVGALIGNPSLKPSAEINDADINEELSKLMALLQSNKIVVESIAGIDEREFYRFITEELIHEETDSKMPGNMIMCFIYEEFHPNHPHDIERRAREFIDCMQEKEKTKMDFFMSSGEGEIENIKMENLHRRIALFKDAFDEINIEEFHIKQINISKEETTAELICSYRIEALPPGSRVYHQISGEGVIYFENKYDWWCISDVAMKGVV
jgi:hypothetical protein